MSKDNLDVAHSLNSKDDVFVKYAVEHTSEITNSFLKNSWSQCCNFPQKTVARMF